MHKKVFLLLILFSLKVMAEPAIPVVSSSKGLAPNLNLTPNPTPAVVKINEAKQAYWEEDYPKACELWRQALNLSPFHPEGIWHDIGLCSEKQGKYTEAIDALTHAIAVQNNPDFYAFRGEMYFKNKQLDLAQKDFEDFFKMKNLNPDKCYRTMARLFWKEGDYEQSLNYAEKGIEKLDDINRSYLIVNKAGALALLKRIDEAASFLEENELVFADLNDAEEDKKLNDYYKNTAMRIYRLKVFKEIGDNRKDEVYHYLRKMYDIDSNDSQVKKALCNIQSIRDDIDNPISDCPQNRFGYRLGYKLGHFLRTIFKGAE